MCELTHKRLCSILNYEPLTGHFSRKTKRRTNAFGTVGNYRPDGYLVISIDKKLYLAHRLAWFFVTGKWPKETIDHINCDKSDNRWCNLREASLTQNNFNVGIFKTNTTGYKGVSKAKFGKYRAVISLNNKQLHLGTFDTPEEAYQVYCQKAFELREEFTNVG